MEKKTFKLTILLNLLILTISLSFGSAIAQPVDITSLEHQYNSNTNTWIKVKDKPGNAQDWVGIYPVGVSSDWGNVVDWSWANETSEANDPGDWYKFTLPDGNYEARFFLNNTYNIEDSTPFIVGDVVSINTLKSVYGVNENISVNVANISGNQDWVGIYPKVSSNSWGNVKTWAWATQNGDLNITGVEAGEYEARLFFNNSFSVESKVVFNVSDETQTTLSTSKENYNENETINVTVSNLSGDQDWVGVYRKNSDNSWNNVIAWNWVTGDGSFELSKIKKDMPVGEYEVRLFFHNSYQLEAKATFKTVDVAVNYAAYGSYTPVRIDINDMISIYKPKKDGVFKQHSPVVIIGAGGWGSTGTRQEEFNNFIASKGYFVIGVGTRTDRAAEFNRILETLDMQGNLVDKNKIGLMGSSTGGGTIFYNLKRLKDAGYAANNFVISLEGWFALGLSSAEVRNLETTTLLLQFGGADGLRYSGTETVTPYYAQTGADNFQDPRILMSIYNMLPGNEKALSFLNNNEHNYAVGSMEGKNDMLNVVGAMLAYKFENGGQTAKNVALNNKYSEINAAKFDVGKYHYGCTQGEIDNQAYNYCDTNNPQ